MSWGKMEHNNWGDDINMFFLKKITNDTLLPQKVMSFPQSDIVFKVDSNPTITCIGSILQNIEDDNTIVWGSGFLTDKKKPHIRPENILAVRGPLTRQVFISNGIKCPEVYGDPALLLPYFYKPKCKKKYQIGIIPHFYDYNKDEVRQYEQSKSSIIINTFNYRNWKDFIDKICSCHFIVSSSLHGLIVAEAYNIPNLWVEFNEPLIDDTTKRFKFHDFFLSIAQDRDYPYTVTRGTPMETLLKQKEKYIKAKGLSLIPLVEVCPFTIKKSIRKKIIENDLKDTRRRK